MTTTVLPDLLTVAEAAEAMGIGRQGVHDRIRAGMIQAVKPSARLLLIPRAEVERFRGVGKLPTGPKPGTKRRKQAPEAAEPAAATQQQSPT